MYAIFGLEKVYTLFEFCWHNMRRCLFYYLSVFRNERGDVYYLKNGITTNSYLASTMGGNELSDSETDDLTEKYLFDSTCVFFFFFLISSQKLRGCGLANHSSEILFYQSKSIFSR